MHLLTASPGGYGAEEGIIDLDQSPGEVVLLCCQDGVLSLLSDALEQLPREYPTVRLANLLQLGKEAALDLYFDKVVERARVVVVSLLGGRSYWRYAFDRCAELAAGGEVLVALVPGDDHPDEELFAAGNLEREDTLRMWRYLREGGEENAANLLRFLAARFFERRLSWEEPREMPHTFLFREQAPGEEDDTVGAAGTADTVGTADTANTAETADTVDATDTVGAVSTADSQADHETEAPEACAALILYRSQLQDGGGAQLCRQLAGLLREEGLRPLPIITRSLKEARCRTRVEELCQRHRAEIVLNATGFSSGAQPLGVDAPVLQLLLPGNSRNEWQSQSHGLYPRDIAMQVALPEMDGRIIGRPVAFKEHAGRGARGQVERIVRRADRERTRFMAQLAQAWVRLRRTPNASKRVALVLANYPARDGRIGNGVGLDSGASLLAMLHAMTNAGFPVSQLPENGTALLRRMLEQVTNDAENAAARPCGQSISLAQYRRFFERLPRARAQEILSRWGPPEQDPMVRDGRIMVTGTRFGLAFAGIQPARGYQIDLQANYHDPDLAPPHSYLAFYFWIRHCYGAHAVVHVGKHGTLEWLPGKSLALGPECWPEIALGPLPHLYPFIVNDPGEGSQAKRRAQAVILDHLTPPLTQAGSYGALRELERLLDEYYQAQQLDARRAEYLRGEILRELRGADLEGELEARRITARQARGAAAQQDAQKPRTQLLLEDLDAYLCELKELQIRDGLHIFGRSPRDQQRSDTLLALARIAPCNSDGNNDQQSGGGLLHALAADLALRHPDGTPFDPLQHDAAAPWRGPRPALLQKAAHTPWRSCGDTRERLENLARHCIEQGEAPPESPRTRAALDFLLGSVAPRLDACGAMEMRYFLHALNGGFVPPGPSGAPSRGRADVLPTGRNFYSLDTRSVPTPAAWQLGRVAAEELLRRHLQEHGAWPARIGMSVWGTSTMRTGGDDIAQALALMGVEPLWDENTGRLRDFRIMPAEELGRPRVDITLRVSGFFRDAFANVITLFDQAVQALAALPETAQQNPLRAHVQAQAAQDGGADSGEARRRALWRIFGPKPGAYGAGLKGLIDQGLWQDSADLASAYLNWGAYAYGAAEQGSAARHEFRTRLEQLQLVLHNQDNREHDILDSDDYYQFQGGMYNAARVWSKTPPALYHGDHSNPAAPRVRTLREELQRVMRARVLNPKWLAGVRRHGYRGAAEMAATVDYLFAYDATTGMVEDYHYARLSATWLEDPQLRAFLREHNPHALRDMTERLLEAIRRGLWQNSENWQQRLEEFLQESEEALEDVVSSG